MPANHHILQIGTHLRDVCVPVQAFKIRCVLQGTAALLASMWVGKQSFALACGKVVRKGVEAKGAWSLRNHARDACKPSKVVR